MTVPFMDMACTVPRYIARPGDSEAYVRQADEAAILSKDPTSIEPTTIAEIKVTETVKEGKTIFRLEPGARADSGMPDITPLLVAFGGHRGPIDSCAHDAMVRMTAVMAGSPAGR